MAQTIVRYRPGQGHSQQPPWCWLGACRWLGLWPAALLTVLGFCAAANPRLQAAEVPMILPPDFAWSLVADGLELPTDMVFLPSGEILVTEKGGLGSGFGVAHVRMIRDGELMEVPVLSLATSTQGDSGLLSIALDANFSANRHFYLWYSTAPESLSWSGRATYRLSRFTLDPLSDRADPATERIVLDHVPRDDQGRAYHNGGGLLMDRQGLLYVSTGDMFKFSPAQNLGVLNGKVLRIRPGADGGYTVPADNPYVATSGVPPEIYALGLRNPFRMTQRAADGAIFIADVGHGDWEEVNQLAPAANYGWPVREGPCPIGERLPCAPAPSIYTDPVFSYAHPLPSGGSSITGLTVYAGQRFPPVYQNHLFYVDYNRQFIGVAHLDQAGQGRASPADASHDIDYFATAAGFLIDIEYADDALYVLDIYAGRVVRIDYVGAALPPRVYFSPDRSSGTAPLTVHFAAQINNPVAGMAYSYRWELGDGSNLQITDVPRLTYSYARDGTYRVELSVVDAQGTLLKALPETLVVYSGELPTVELTILDDPQRDRFHGGDRIRFAPQRAAGLGGLDPVRPYSWRVDLHHNQHAHPIITDLPLTTGVFDVSTANHSNSTELWYRFELTMHTAEGQAIRVSREISPALTIITLAPLLDYRARDFVVNRIRRSLPYRFESVVGIEHEVRAPARIVYDGGVYAFPYWDQAAGQGTEFRFLAPAQPTTYQLWYLYLRPAHQLYLPSAGR